MNSGYTIVFETTIPQGKLTIRYPVMDDIHQTLDYINALSKEQTFIRHQGERISLKEETIFLRSQLEKVQNKTGVILFAFLDNTLVGICNIECKNMTESHQGVLGISIAANFRGLGIGKFLMKNTINEARKRLSQLRMISLGIFEGNTVAKTMYEQLGFKEYGRLPNGIHYKNSYIDHILMYKTIDQS